MTNAWASFVILDDVRTDALKIESHLKQIFTSAGLEIEAIILTSSNEAREALETHPDFFICDVRLGTMGESAGLELIQNLKPQYPHVNFIAVTMQFEKMSAGLSYIVVQPDFILSKAKIFHLPSPEFDNYLFAYCVVNRRQNRGLTISRRPEVERTCKQVLGWSKFKPELFDCLVRQVFKSFDVRLDAAQFAIDERQRQRINPKEFLGEIVDFVKIKSMDHQGESGSAVFKAETKYQHRPYKVGLILKFCPMQAFIREVGNFSRYVKWMLPYSWRVDILGDGVSENVGVIAYSLAMDGSSSDAQPLRSYITAGNPEPVLSFIRQVFSPTNKTWYAAVETARGRNLAHDLWSRYFDRDPSRQTKHINSLKTKLQNSEVFAEIYAQDRFGAIDEFIDRVRQLAINSPVLNNYERCICHGDLHCGNIMVAGRKIEGSEQMNWQFAFIDFQDTGPAHIGTDFVVFENALRKDSRFELGMSNANYYRTERDLILNLLSGNPAEAGTEAASAQADAKISLIDITNEVRSAFFANFEEGADKPNREHFVFHLFAFTLFMINDKFAGLERREILLAFFCAVVDALYEFRRRVSHGNTIVGSVGPANT